MRPALDLEMPSSAAISRMDLPASTSSATFIFSWLTSESSCSLRCSFSLAKPRAEKWTKPPSDTISWTMTLSEPYLYSPARTFTCLTYLMPGSLADCPMAITESKKL